jgi:hypothetical protein
MNRKNPGYIRRKLGTTGIDLDPEKLNYVVLSHYANRYYSISGDVGIHFKVITYTFKDLDRMIHFYTEDPFEDLKLVYQNCKLYVNGKKANVGVEVSLSKYKEYSFGGSVTFKPKNGEKIPKNSLVVMDVELLLYSEFLKNKEKMLRTLKEKFNNIAGIGFISNSKSPTLRYKEKFSMHGYKIENPMLIKIIKLNPETEVPEAYEILKRLKVSEDNSISFSISFPKVETLYAVIFNMA